MRNLVKRESEEKIEILETKISMKQIKNLMETTANRLYQAGERVSETEEKVEKLLHSESNKVSICDHSIQDLWVMKERPSQ
jgi:cob(I)alamin adenosyltransferase